MKIVLKNVQGNLNNRPFMNGNVSVKRLGNTTIKSSNPALLKRVLTNSPNPNANIMKVLTPQRTFSPAPSNLKIISPTRVVPKSNIIKIQQPLQQVTRTQPQSVPSTVTATGKISPHARYTNESYVKELEDQNKEMKRMLLDMRRDATQIQMRMHKITNQINSFLSKSSFAKPISSAALEPIEKVVKVGTQLCPKPPVTTGIIKQSPIVLPSFPVKRPDVLKQLESDLRNRQFFDHVYSKLLAINKVKEISGPVSMLLNVLDSIIDPILLAQIKWDDTTYTEKTFSMEGPIQFKLYVRTRSLFHRIANCLTNLKFGKNVDSNAVENFLKRKVTEKKDPRRFQTNPELTKKIVAGHPQVKIVKLSNINIDNDEKNSNDDAKSENGSNEGKLEWLGEEDDENGDSDTDDTEEGIEYGKLIE
jgi:hypothetical protein